MNQFLEESLKEAFDTLSPIFSEDESYIRSRPIAEVARVVSLTGSLYIRYIIVVNKLISAHKYMLHPNKRPHLESLIEKILGRILELKHEMVDIENSDFQYLNSIIICNFISKRNAQLIIPTYYQTVRKEILQELYAKLDEIVYKRDHPVDLIEKEENEESEARTSVRSSGRGSVRESLRGSVRGSHRGSSRRGTTASEFERRRQEEEERQKKEDLLKKRPKFQSIQVYEFLEEVKLIQRHERARVARLYVQSVKDRLRVEYEKAWHIYKPIPEDLLYGVTRAIQKHWKKYRQRRIEHYENVQRRIIYGTLTPSYRTTTDISALLKERQNQQTELEKAMEQTLQLLSINLERDMKEDIKDDMLEELRLFIKTWYEVTKEYGYTELPEWPSDDCFEPPFIQMGIPEGLPKEYLKENFTEVPNDLGGQKFPLLCGSEFISAGHWITPEQYAPAVEQARRIMKEGKPAVDPKKAAQEKEAAKERAEKEKEEAERKMEELRRMGHVPWKSKFFNEVKLVSRGYLGEFGTGQDLSINPKQKMEELRRMGHVPWKSKFFNEVKLVSRGYLGEFGTGQDLSINPKQGHDEEILKSKVIYEIRKDLRPEVDEMIREELEVFQAAIDADEAGRKKAPKLPKKRKPKEQKKKKKEKKDPTGNRTIESLFEDLVMDGIIIKCNPIKLNSLPGEYNHHGQSARAGTEDPMPSIADVYQVANEYITIPLGSKELRERTPQIKSVLFVGPNSFTHPLVHAIAYASGALLFYLRALNFECRYNPKLLLNVLTKVSTEYQPAIIFVDGAEKPFYKKVPKEEKEMNPGSLKHILGKLVKGLKGSDRVIVIGTAENPWLSKPGPMLKPFQKVLPFPECDFHPTSTIVQETLMKYPGVEREFNTAVPAYFFLGQPLADIKQRLDSIFTLDRILNLKYKPLTIEETGCIEKEPPPPSPLEQWYKNNYPLCKRRKTILQAEAERKEREAKVKEKANK